jgi:hypothetical protein
MYGLLKIYARPYDAKEPVVCVDEKSKQLLRQTRSPLPVQPGRCAKEDYEYKRAGTRNIFMAAEPKGGRRVVEVTARRAKPDFVSFVKHLVESVYAAAATVHLVLDNLNTHFRKTFVDVLGKAAATVLLRRVTFHYTPKHGELVEYGRDRNRNHGPTMHGTAHRHCGTITSRRTVLAAAAEHRKARHRVDVHAPRCGPQIASALCSVIILSQY